MAVGRTPAPAALKLVNGRSEGRDSGGRVVKTPPKFDRVTPTPPRWLPKEARAEWERIVPDLERLGILKRIDAAALTAYCMTWQRFVEASQIIEVEGMSCTDRAGKVTRNPALVTVETASRELRAWAGEFGLTPSAETRLSKLDESNAGNGNPFAAPQTA